jgi:hypothetical protein
MYMQHTNKKIRKQTGKMWQKYVGSHIFMWKQNSGLEK